MSKAGQPEACLFLEPEAVEEARVELSASENRVMHDLFVEGDGGLDTHDDEFVQRSRHAGYSLVAVMRRDDELADHRVIVRWHDVARIAVRVDPDSGASGCVEHLDFTW